jgi:hypothetical protein
LFIVPPFRLLVFVVVRIASRFSPLLRLVLVILVQVVVGSRRCLLTIIVISNGVEVFRVIVVRRIDLFTVQNAFGFGLPKLFVGL